jgi:hypothetical protein
VTEILLRNRERWMGQLASGSTFQKSGLPEGGKSSGEAAISLLPEIKHT